MKVRMNLILFYMLINKDTGIKLRLMIKNLDGKESFSSTTPQESDEVLFCPHEFLTPLQYFEKVLDGDFINYLVHYGSLYSVQENGISIDTNVSEMHVFLCILIIMRVINHLWKITGLLVQDMRILQI